LANSPGSGSVVSITHVPANSGSNNEQPTPIVVPSYAYGIALFVACIMLVVMVMCILVMSGKRKKKIASN
jgi:hypothetical protein